MTEGPTTKESLRRRVLDEIFFKPANSLLPAFIGIPMALAPWVMDKPHVLTTAIGLGISFLSVGVYITRVCLNWGNEDVIREKVLQAEAYKTEQTLRRRQIATRHKLVRDQNPLTEQMFDRLIALQETLTEEAKKPSEDIDHSIILTNVEELVNASINNLDESAHLWQKAQATRIPALAKEILKQRDDLLAETSKSIESVETILLAFAKNRKNHRQTETVRIRKELEAQLDISERVKKQMESWTINRQETNL